ncbi:MAG: hypothetical protein M3Y69_00955 [Verrucomicrobiota bacterium]|nr:hypothetical protein [Verrucomicrobiota bacterium]
MEPADSEWFLRKHEDGTAFGPLRFAQLARWASSAQVAPNDSISSDQVSWIKAPMLPELGMDWIVEVTSERSYGPTTLGAVGEFLRLGEVGEATVVINACDGSRHQIRDIAAVLQSPVEPPDEIATAGPAAVGIAVDVPERIRELERALREERRAMSELEERHRLLEAKYREQIGV